jgi:hypothetical protein
MPAPSADGSLPPPLTIPSGNGPVFVARMDPDTGGVAWVGTAGSGIPSQAYAVAAAANGAFVTGYFNAPATFGEGTPQAITLSPDSGRAFVASWGWTGQLRWARPVAGPMGEGDAVTATAAGDVVVAGTFEGQGTFIGGASTLTADSPGQPGCFLAQLAGADGNAAWARRLAGRGIHPWHVRTAAAGDLLVAASFGGGVVVDPDGPAPATVVSAGDDDALVVRLDPTGRLRWATPVGGLGDDEGSDVAEASDRFVWATGRYVGPVTFGTGAAAVTLGSGTDGAGFVIRLWP